MTGRHEPTTTLTDWERSEIDRANEGAVDVADDDPSALGGELMDDPASDVGRAAGHDHPRSGQSKVHCCSFALLRLRR